MATRLKRAPATNHKHPVLPHAAPYDTPPWTTEECLQRIEAMGKQTNEYVESMQAVCICRGASAEAKLKAATAFYDCMVLSVRQLAHIYDEHRLE